MLRSSLLSCLTLGLLLVAACGDDEVTDDGGLSQDGSTGRDTGPVDTGPSDSGGQPDSGTPDGGLVDSGVEQDGGLVDSGVSLPMASMFDGYWRMTELVVSGSTVAISRTSAPVSTRSDFSFASNAIAGDNVTRMLGKFLILESDLVSDLEVVTATVTLEDSDTIVLQDNMAEVYSYALNQDTLQIEYDATDPRNNPGSHDGPVSITLERMTKPTDTIGTWVATEVQDMNQTFVAGQCTILGVNPSRIYEGGLAVDPLFFTELSGTVSEWLNADCSGDPSSVDGGGLLSVTEQNGGVLDLWTIDGSLVSQWDVSRTADTLSLSKRRCAPMASCQGLPDGFSFDLVP